MEQERTGVPPEKTGAEPMKMRSCILEAGDEGLRLVVDGRVAKVLAFDTYEAFYKNLTRGLEFNIFPLEIAGGGEIKLQLPPLAEIRAGAVELHSPDGVTYGRQYKLASVQKEADGKSYAVITRADTGEVVEQEPWEDFKRRVVFDRCRSGTSYRAMVGEFSPRLHFDITGQIYQPVEEKPKPTEPEPAERRAAEQKKAEAKERAPKEPLLRAVAAGTAWLRKHPRYIGILAALVCAIVLVAESGIVRTRGHGSLKSKPAMSPAQLDYHLNQEYEIAQKLSAVDFAKYARDYPKAAKDSVENLAAFVEKNQHTPGLSAEQSGKMRFIANVLPRLQAGLAKAAEK